MTPVRLSVPWRKLAGCVACAALVAVSACSSPASRFYTLSATDAQGPVRASANPALLIEVSPVDMPAQLARTAFVVQRGPRNVDVLEQTRWASLPADEIRHALSEDLMQRLGTIDVSGSAYPESALVYRVSMHVQRFESWPDSHILNDAVWSVRAVHTDTVLTCRSVIREPASGGNDGLVDAHRRAVQQISAEIAAGIESLAAASRVSGSASVKGDARASKASSPPAVSCPAG
jgi:uncharacterized lipoprotein YmbA